MTEPPKFYVTQTFKMGKFDTATQTLCYVSGLHNFRGFNPPPRVFRSGYVNTKRVLFCFYKIILIKKCELKTSPPCLYTLIRYCSCREDTKSIFSRKRIMCFFITWTIKIHHGDTCLHILGFYKQWLNQQTQSDKINVNKF